MTDAPDPADELLARLRALDVRLEASDDGGLRYDAPRAVLSEPLLGELRRHKDELLDRLTAPPGTAVDRAPVTLQQAYMIRAHEHRGTDGAPITPSIVVMALRDLGVAALKTAIKEMGDAGAAMLGPIRIAGCGVEVDVLLPSPAATAPWRLARVPYADVSDGRHCNRWQGQRTQAFSGSVSSTMPTGSGSSTRLPKGRRTRLP